MSAPTAPSFPIERHTLDNGLRVILQPDASLPLVAINLWYHVGSKNERPKRTGLAHLFEHMLFQGSQHVGTNDHFRYLQQVGGVANGSTWVDRTNYFETLPAHYLDLGLWLESDRMGFLLPAIDQKKLDTQREVVMNERRERVDNQPYGRAFERIHELLYPGDHPYHWPVIGYMEDIAAATLEDLEEFFRTYYAPDNAVLTLTGELDTQRALERVIRYFGEIPRGEGVPPVRVDTGHQAGEQHETMADEVQLARVYFAYATPPLGTQEWYAGDLLATALSDGKSSPLYRDLVYEQQIAQDVSAYNIPMELGSTFLLAATAKPEVEIGQVERALEDQLARAREEGPSEDDVERARQRQLTAIFDRLQSVDERADLLSMYTTYFDDPQRIFQEFHRYLAIEASELKDFSARFLTSSRRVVLQVVPKDSKQ
ncbi:MAG: pitrilysin family protein [Thermoanaerobaculia bacterium]